MDTPDRQDQYETTDADLEMALRMRSANSDAAFVADGIRHGLLLGWAEHERRLDDQPIALGSNPACHSPD
jgi:hypothetical protein